MNQSLIVNNLNRNNKHNLYPFATKWIITSINAISIQKFSDAIEVLKTVYNINEIINLTSKGWRGNTVNRLQKINLEPVCENVMLYDVIKWNEKEYILNKPIEAQIKQESEYFIFEYEPLGIYAYGKTFEEAEDLFFEEFDNLYQVIAKEDDENLHESAIRIKKKLLGFF